MKALDRLLNWTPTDAQMRAICAIGRRFDSCLKAAVILTGLYLAIEIASAFLPGGPVERVLGGGR